MIAFGVIVFTYLFIGWAISYEAHKRNWNARLTRWDQASHMGWWLFWWFKGAPIFSQTLDRWTARFGAWSQNALGSLFDRMTEFEWRRNGTEDES